MFWQEDGYDGYDAYGCCNTGFGSMAKVGIQWPWRTAGWVDDVDVSWKMWFQQKKMWVDLITFPDTLGVGTTLEAGIMRWASSHVETRSSARWDWKGLAQLIAMWHHVAMWMWNSVNTKSWNEGVDAVDACCNCCLFSSNASFSDSFCWNLAKLEGPSCPCATRPLTWRPPV